MVCVAQVDDAKLLFDNAGKSGYKQQLPGYAAGSCSKTLHERILNLDIAALNSKIPLLQPCTHIHLLLISSGYTGSHYALLREYDRSCAMGSSVAHLITGGRQSARRALALILTPTYSPNPRRPDTSRYARLRPLGVELEDNIVWP